MEAQLDILYKTEIFRNIVKNLNNISNEDKNMTFYVRDINNEENNTFIKQHYSYLKRHFKLPHHSRTPKKLTSQTLLSMFKDCKLEYKKRTKAYSLLGNKTTSGFYEVVV